MYDNAVRFTVQNDRVETLRAEVFDLAGKRLFDSGLFIGQRLRLINLSWYNGFV